VREIDRVAGQNFQTLRPSGRASLSGGSRLVDDQQIRGMGHGLPFRSGVDYEILLVDADAMRLPTNRRKTQTSNRCADESAS
jgi:hypothetical protein